MTIGGEIACVVFFVAAMCFGIWLLGKLFGPKPKGRGPPAAVSQWRIQPLPVGRRVDVVGEASYQDELEDVAGGRTYRGADELKTAVLVPEPSNPYDPNAIRVTIDGVLVGYLSRKNAELVSEYLNGLAAQGTLVSCSARVVGGWRRKGGDDGHFGVVLDVDFPVKRKTTKSA